MGFLRAIVRCQSVVRGLALWVLPWCFLPLPQWLVTSEAYSGSPRKQLGTVIALGCAQWSSRISHKGFTDTFLLVNLIWALLFTYGLHFYYIYAFPSRNLYNDTSYYTAITGYCKADLFDLCHRRFVNTEKCLLHLHYRWWKHNRLIGYQLYGIQVGSRRPIFSNAMGIGSTGFGSDLCYSLHWKVQMGSDI